MEQVELLGKLPLPAILMFGATLAVIFYVRHFGLRAGENSAPARKQAAAEVAAVIVDPTALNNATRALEAHTEAVEDLTDTAKDLNRSVSHMAIEIDRIREELRIQHELARRAQLSSPHA